MKKLVILLVLFILSFSLCSTVTFAKEKSIGEISLTEVTDQERLDYFFENISIRIEEREPIKSSIDCFAVNEKGMIAIIHNSSLGRRYIRIISNDGTFVKAFSYKQNSSAVAIRWDGDNLQIFSIRGGVAFTMDMEANILGVYDFTQDEAWYEYYENDLDAKEKTVENVTYKVTKDFSKPIGEKIIVNSEEGTKVIYNDNGVGMISGLIFGIAFVAFFLTVFIKAVIATKNKN